MDDLSKPMPLSKAIKIVVLIFVGSIVYAIVGSFVLGLSPEFAQILYILATFLFVVLAGAGWGFYQRNKYYWRKEREDKKAKTIQ